MIIDDQCNNMDRLKKDADMETMEGCHIFEIIKFFNPIGTFLSSFIHLLNY